MSTKWKTKTIQPSNICPTTKTAPMIWTFGIDDACIHTHALSNKTIQIQSWENNSLLKPRGINIIRCPVSQATNKSFPMHYTIPLCLLVWPQCPHHVTSYHNRPWDVCDFGVWLNQFPLKLNRERPITHETSHLLIIACLQAVWLGFVKVGCGKEGRMELS